MDTIMAPLTPVQPAAVIVLRISGDVMPLMCYFSVDSDNMKPRTAIHTSFVSASNKLISDDVIIIYYKAPNSYTGEDVLEISFHGNPVIVNAAMKDFTANGVRMAEAGEFTKRAYINQKLTFSQAEAVNSLIRASTAVGVSASRHTLYGELDGVFYSIRDELISALAEMEAVIDFSEELHELQELNITKKLDVAARQIKALLNNYYDVQRAINGINVVIVGEANAGKSTLFNSLLGKNRAIVSNEEGTTRDVLTEQLHLNGVQLKLSDTAGMRKSSSVSENEGIKRAINAFEASDLVLILIDLSRPIKQESLDLIDNNNIHKKIVVGTKNDLERNNNYDVDIAISANDSESLDILKKMIDEVVAGIIPAEDIGPAIMAENQRIECELALEELNQINHELPLDLQAYHLRMAASALDRSQGLNIAEETLDMLFSKFCIGK